MREGTYWGVLTRAAFGKSRNKGTPQVAIDWNVTHVRNDDSGEYESIVPQTKTVTLYFSDGSKDITTKALEELGFNGNFEDPGFNDAVKSDGHELYMKCEDYKGQPQEKWNIGGLGGGAEPLQNEEVLQLKARWNAWSKKPVAGNPGGGPQGGGPAAPTQPGGAPGKSPF